MKNRYEYGKRKEEREQRSNKDKLVFFILLTLLLVFCIALSYMGVDLKAFVGIPIWVEAP